MMLRLVTLSLILAPLIGAQAIGETATAPKGAVATPTGRVWVYRKLPKAREAAKAAIEVLDALMQEEGLMRVNPFDGASPDPKAYAQIEPDDVTEFRPICMEALMKDDPVRAMQVEVKFRGYRDERRYAVYVTCKMYWSGFLDTENKLWQ